jgi:hypothetical protein
MPTTLVQRFKDAVDAFNACRNEGDYSTKVGPFLHENVIMDEVDSPHTRHSGKANVLNYLDTQQAHVSPQFYPDYSNCEQDPKNSTNATSAWVSGLAGYQDTLSAPQRIQARYRFQFRRRDINAEWLITVATAEP